MIFSIWLLSTEHVRSHSEHTFHTLFCTNYIYAIVLLSHRMFGFVAKGAEAGSENVCHIFAEYDSLQSCNKTVELIQAAIAQTPKDRVNSNSMRL